MTPQQKKLRDLVAELLEAEVNCAKAKGGRLGMKQHVENVLPGIEDGTFFELPMDSQGAKLGWLGGAYFGRGEAANGLLDLGLLREEFPDDFFRERSAYLRATGYVNRIK